MRYDQKIHSQKTRWLPGQDDRIGHDEGIVGSGSEGGGGGSSNNSNGWHGCGHGRNNDIDIDINDNDGCQRQSAGNSRQP